MDQIFTQRNWLPELDGMRGIAALLVIWGHYQATPFNPTFSITKSALDLSLPNIAVAVFYSLSAFLLSFLAVREFDSKGRFFIVRFFLRRILRIWPLYFL